MIRLFFILYAIISCNYIVEKVHNPVLECILDTYISEFSMRLGNEISLFESHGWTDSTLNLSVLTIKSERLASGKYFFTEYKDAKLYLAQGELYQKEGLQLELFLDRNKMVSNKLKWEIVEINNQEEVGIVPPEQFDEVQMIYNTESNCIEKSNMMNQVRFKDRIKSNCGFCN